MKTIADFDLLRPATLTDAAMLMGRDGARPVAGGTDLLPNLRRGLGEPRCLVDLSAVAGFGDIEQVQGGWRLGAGVTLATLARHGALAAALPALTQAAAAVAGPAHRSAATLGGNLCQDTRCVYYNQSDWWRGANQGCLKLKGDTCHVAPQGQRCHAAYAGDLAPALLAYGAEAEIVDARTRTRRPLDQLFRDDGAAHLALEPRQILASLHLPAAHAGRVSGFQKLRVRGAMDFALASVAVALRLEGGVLAELAVGVSGTNSRPLLIEGTAALLGRPVDDALVTALGKLVHKQVSPMRSTVTAAHHRRLVAATAAQRLVLALAGATRAQP